ncbi:MAG: hypothetical protein Pars2KO_00150 [Parasphingorhabdus sp.]
MAQADNPIAIRTMKERQIERTIYNTLLRAKQLQQLNLSEVKIIAPSGEAEGLHLGQGNPSARG